MDKAGQSTAGSLAQSLMPFLEAETARAYPDPCLEVEADLSRVNYCLTANDDSKLPSPLRDRIRIIRVPSPTAAHIESLARSIMQDLAAEMGIPAAFLQPLAPDELAVVSKMWGENGSVRKLQKIIRGTVTARDQHASRH
jgi:ATP-dependent Lon protease